MIITTDAFLGRYLLPVCAVTIGGVGGGWWVGGGELMNYSIMVVSPTEQAIV
jgi:hypothetical protein